MSWQPRITVFDERKLKDNLFGYIQANQTDALAWANESSSPALPDIAAFHKSARLTTVFPALTILQTDHGFIYEDTTETSLSFLFEMAIAHGNQDTLDAMAAKYMMALESMLVNCPKTTFSQGSIIVTNSVLQRLDTVTQVQGKFANNKFLQIFQTKAAWEITATAYS